LDIEYHKILNKCWDNNIKVIQKPLGTGKHNKPPSVKLIASIDFNYIQGKHIYDQNSIELEKAIEDLYRVLYNNYI
tara:strand:+ start:277 stop:504 length:228 start_codon:yes stop_codon:yes gene_type:complete